MQVCCDAPVAVAVWHDDSYDEWMMGGDGTAKPAAKVHVHANKWRYLSVRAARTGAHRLVIANSGGSASRGLVIIYAPPALRAPAP